MTRRRLLPALAVAFVLVACTSDGEQPPVATSTSTTAVSHTSTTVVADTSTTSTSPATSTTSAPVTTSTVPLDELVLAAIEVGSGFDAPVFLHADPDGRSDLVVEQPGRIVRLDDRSVVLDIRDDVTYGGEQGLLGLAFHPDFAKNRLAYLNYIDAGGDTRIESMLVKADGVFDPSSRAEILVVEQPARNHNGGMIAFGPDGYLWIGMGDGGGSDDRFGNGQRADTLLGSMLRIEVGPGIEGYAVPADNPRGDFAPEVWWIGLRNPWRFSFDSTEAWSNVYIADVGQRQIEEVTIHPASFRGANFGWPIMEASACFQTSDCQTDDLVLPQIEYDHSQGCSITGGYVYRGATIPELDGHYFYSDYCTGFLRSWEFEGEVHDWSEQVGSLGNVSSFGVGGDGELYIITLSGTIYRLERAS